MPRSCPRIAAAVCSLALAAASGADVYQTVNEDLDPAPFYWAAPTGNIGWYWTPETDVLLSGIQTRLAVGFTNVNNDFTFTTTLYSDRPSEGGIALGSFDWSGVEFVDGLWLGGTFDTALALDGGTTYFLGMSGWEQGLTGNGGSGVNWINPPDQPGGESLGAGSGYTGTGFDTQMNTGAEPANVDSPVLRFIEVPAPSASAALAAIAMFAPRRRRS